MRNLMSCCSRTLGMLALAATCLAIVTSDASAQTRQFDDVLRGDIQLIGNVNLECDPALNTQSCTDIHSGAIEGKNNSIRRRWVDVDDANFTPPSTTAIATADTYNSSSMRLTLPPGATVVRAELTFKGNLEDRFFTDSQRPANLEQRFARSFLGTEATGYVQIDATRCRVTQRVDAGNAFLPDIVNTSDSSEFQDCYDAYVANDKRLMDVRGDDIDVTNIVMAQGSGDYYFADLPTTEKPGKLHNFASLGYWVMWVVYEDGGELRRIFIDSDSGGIGSGNPTNEITIDYTDFVTPLTGTVTGRFIAAVSDGDYVGYAKIDGTKISDAVNSEDKLWQHNISVLGNENVQRDPAFLNTLDIDINVFDVSSYLSNDAQSVSLELGGASSGNGIGFELLGFSVQVRTGDIVSEKRVSAVNGNPFSPGDRIRPGDTVTYELTLYNDGEGDAVDTVLTDPIPGGTSYVADSMMYQPSGGAFASVSDTVGDDVCEYDGGGDTITCFLGSGANPGAGTGGLVDEAVVTAAAPIVFTFDVTIDTEGGGVVTENQATVTFTDFTSTTTGTTVSNDPTSVDAGDPTTVAVCGNTIVEAGESCDAGSGNGASTCACTTDCEFPSMMVVCSDGLFCTNEDSCDGAGACVSDTQSPCSGGTPFCDEANDECDECAAASDCQDGSLCNGIETCDNSGTCQDGTPTVCQSNATCVEASNICVCDAGFVPDGNGGCIQSQCNDGSDCDDSNVCTNDMCTAGICTNVPDVGASCDNGSFCDGDETCSALGTCVASGNPCGGSAPFCDETNNECDECQSASDCTDNLACTGVETCDASGTCQSGTAVTCAANSTCTEPGGTCACDTDFVPDDSGVCVPRECTLDIDCNDANICTADSCEGGLCVNGIMNGASCDNGDFCDGEGTCNASADCIEPGNPCSGSTPICDEFENQCEACVDDSTDATDTGCDVSTPFCDDSDASNPVCVACEVAADCGSTTNDCTAFACNAGACDEEPLSNGTSCSDDGAFCTGAETCQAGVCENSGDPCRTDAPFCDETADVCVECEGNADCDDSVACNGAEVCSAGVCQTGTAVSCDANEVCGEPSGVCDCAPGFVDDGNDNCVASQCTDAGDCDDANVCTADSCENGLCAFAAANAGGDCDNGDFCDGAGTCDAAGSCVEPGNPCASTDSPVCDEATDICLVCVDNNDDSADQGCTSAIPFCDESDPANPVCVGCETSADCGATGSECTTFACNAGSCEEENLSNGASCSDDGDFCTGVESCQDGICAGAGSPCSGEAPFCDDVADVCVACETDVDCTDALVCNGDETCVAGTCLAGVAVVCDTNELCSEPAGLCDCAPGFVDDGSGVCIVPACDTDDDCDDASICTTDTCEDNLCAFVPTNEGGDCGGGNVCEAGVCGPECTLDTDCDAGEVCDSGTCGPECTVDSDCSGSEVCETGTCGPECTQDTDCEVGEICSEINTCTPECNDDADCPGTQVCEAGVCGPECLTDADCPDGNGCSETSATCEPDCTTNDDCEEGQTCAADGTCTTPCSESAECPDDQICDTTTSTCGPECLSDSDCDADEVCDPASNTCGPECVTSADCEGVLICDLTTGTCVAECTSDDDCAAGETCDSQTLTCEPICDTDADCDAGETCESGMCVTECTTDEDCDEGETCSAAGICEPGCQLSGDCPADQVCDPSLNCQTPNCESDDDCTPAQPFCDVGAQLCVECLASTDCVDDGLFCNGTESCDGSVCISSGDACASGETCNEASDSCDVTPEGGAEAGEFVFTGGSRNCSTTGGMAPVGGMLLLAFGLLALRRRRDEE